MDKVTFYVVTLTLWKYQYGKLCLVIHMILQPGSNTIGKKTTSWLYKYTHTVSVEGCYHIWEAISNIWNKSPGGERIQGDAGIQTAWVTVQKPKTYPLLFGRDVWLPGKCQPLSEPEQPRRQNTGQKDKRWQAQEEMSSSKGVTKRLPYLFVTRWRSFISALSNQTWGQDLTMALWTTPIRPPWTWPT